MDKRWGYTGSAEEEKVPSFGDPIMVLSRGFLESVGVLVQVGALVRMVTRDESEKYVYKIREIKGEDVYLSWVD